MNFAFLLFPGAEELDFIGPWEIVSVWGKYYGRPERLLIVSQTGGTVRCANNLRVVADYSFANCPPLNYLLIPGGEATNNEEKNSEVLAFVRKQATNCQQVLSVCTGSFILQAAGLLEGKKATTYWHSLPRLRSLGAQVVEKRFVRDGNIWTAAGVSAGIDLALALIADQAGEDTAGKVQLAVEYYPSMHRYGNAHRVPDAPTYLNER